MIAARIGEGHFDKTAVVRDDVTTFSWDMVSGPVSGLTGGFPCQAHDSMIQCEE